MAAHPTIERSSLESRERVIEVGKTSRDQRVCVLTGGPDPVLSVRDARGRGIVHVEGDLLAALTKALLEAQQVILPVDEAIESIRSHVALKEASGDLLDALADELKVEISRNSHVQKHVRGLVDVLRGPWSSYDDAWWLS